MIIPSKTKNISDLVIKLREEGYKDLMTEGYNARLTNGTIVVDIELATGRITTYER